MSRAMDERTARALLDAVEAAAAAGRAEQEQFGGLLPKADDVIAAVEHLIEADPNAALRMTARLATFWQDAGRVDDGRRLTELAIERSGGPDTTAHVESLLAASELAFRQGDQAAAEQRTRQAIDVALRLGEPALAAIGQVDLARIAFRAGDAARIEEHARQALELAGDDPRARRGALHMLAWAAHTAGDRATARRRFEESLALRRTIGDRLSVAVEIANLGDLAAEDDDLEDAARRFREALEIAREIDSRYLILNLLPSVAALAARVGDDEAAARLIGATDALSEASGLVPDPGSWQPVLGEVADRLGDQFGEAKHAGAVLDRRSSVQLALDVLTRAHTASSG